MNAGVVVVDGLELLERAAELLLRAALGEQVERGGVRLGDDVLAREVREGLDA
jgi:hypothetical protein